MGFFKTHIIFIFIYNISLINIIYIMNSDLDQTIIQQSRAGQYNLKRISQLDEIDSIDQLDDGYLLLTKPNEKNYIFKFDLIVDRIENYISTHIESILNLNDLIDPETGLPKIDKTVIRNIIEGYLKQYATKSYVDSETTKIKILYGDEISNIKNKLIDITNLIIHMLKI